MLFAGLLGSVVLHSSPLFLLCALQRKGDVTCHVRTFSLVEQFSLCAASVALGQAGHILLGAPRWCHFWIAVCHSVV